jgi:signal peptidase II
VNGVESAPAEQIGQGQQDALLAPRIGALVIALVTAPVLVLDQATKLLIKSHMKPYESIPIIHNWFDLTYTLNPGAAFSMFINAPGWFRSVLLIGLSSIAVVVLLILLLRIHEVAMNSIALALILAGAIGNLIDRLSRGLVVDFIHVHYYSHSYPIFNVADSAITIGVTLIIAHSIFFADQEPHQGISSSSSP